MIEFLDTIFMGLTFFIAAIALFLWILIIVALFMFIRQVKKVGVNIVLDSKKDNGIISSHHMLE